MGDGLWATDMIIGWSMRSGSNKSRGSTEQLCFLTCQLVLAGFGQFV